MDDPAGLDSPGVTPGLDSPGVTPGLPLAVTPFLGGGGDGGGGGGGTDDDLLLVPEGEVLDEPFLSVPGLGVSSGHSERGGRGGAGMLKHANLMGEWLAIAKMACG